MSIFTDVKAGISTIDAATYYGIKINRHGFASCPFHVDKTPSCKFDRRFHCFGCGADGDVIDFTSRLFNIGILDAARKLAHDFNIIYEDSYLNGQKSYDTIKPMVREYSHKDTVKYYIREYIMKQEMWDKLVKEYEPESMYDEWNDEFVHAIEEHENTAIVLGYLLYGSEEEQKEIIKKLQEDS